LCKSLGESSGRHNDKRGEAKAASIFSTLSLFAAFIVPTLILVFSTIRTVPPGHVGIVIEFGKVQDRGLSSGMNMVKPWANIENMSRQIERHTATYQSATADQQEIYVDMTLNYHLMPDRAPQVFDEIGVEYADRIIIPAAQEVLKAETALHKATAILDKRPAVKNAVQQKLGVWLTKYGVQLKEISIAEIKFDDEYDKAIKSKQVQEQEAQKKIYELEKAENQAKIDAAEALGRANALREKAKGEADAAREAAKGNADALTTMGEAQADFNKRVAESLTPALLQSEWLKQWNGDLPRFLFGEGDSKVMPMFQIPMDSKK
jgi:regulator of protease activity HflC (stomatin/prohibitin superfamily)